AAAPTRPSSPAGQPPSAGTRPSCGPAAPPAPPTRSPPASGAGATPAPPGSTSRSSTSPTSTTSPWSPKPSSPSSPDPGRQEQEFGVVDVGGTGGVVARRDRPHGLGVQAGGLGHQAELSRGEAGGPQVGGDLDT